jgi:hypothetical protein
VKEACVTPAGYQESLLSLFSRKGETREGSRAEQGREEGFSLRKVVYSKEVQNSDGITEVVGK